MTSAEYERLYKQSQNVFGNITVDTIKKLKKVYEKSASEVASAVRAAELTGKSQITIQSLTIIENQLAKGANDIQLFLTTSTPEALTDAYDYIFKIDYNYIKDAYSKVDGILPVSLAEIASVQRVINNSLITSMVNRVWQDGYSFSDRVVAAGESYQNIIKEILSGGLAQGRDPVKIAKDITEYVKNGKGAIAGRWGDLLPGTRQYYNRIPRNVDWKALRIIRSELYSSLQQAGVEQGRLNPATTGWYDWILEPNERPIGDPCPDIALNSPYLETEIPVYPHSNCFVGGTKVLVPDGEKEIQEVKIGDNIIDCDGNIQKVLKVFRKKYNTIINEIVLDCKHSLIGTANHPIMTFKKWKTLSELMPMDYVDCVSQRRLITKKILYPFTGFLYNLAVTGSQTYIANDVIVHNCECHVQPVLRNGNEFVSDLQKWANGGSVEYLDDWAEEIKILNL